MEVTDEFANSLYVISERYPCQIYEGRMTNCYIWDTPATMPRDADGDSVYFDSPRAGGKYKITGSAASMLGNLNLADKARLTTWLCDQRAAGVE